MSSELWTEVPYYGTRGTYFADVTGDGKADAISNMEPGPERPARARRISFRALTFSSQARTSPFHPAMLHARSRPNGTTRLARK